jgi:hypothetical protein
VAGVVCQVICFSLNRLAPPRGPRARQVEFPTMRREPVGRSLVTRLRADAGEMVGLGQPLRLNEPASGLLSLSHYAVSLMVIGFSIENITVRLIRICAT